MVRVGDRTPLRRVALATAPTYAAPFPMEPSGALEEERRPSPVTLLFAPDVGMHSQARVGRTLGLLLVAWTCSMLLASALALRVDATSSTLRNLEQSGELKGMSDRQIADETRKSERMFQVVSLAKGALLPPVQVGLQCLAVVGLCWFLRGRLKGRAVAPVAAAAMLPGSLADLVDSISAFRYVSMPPDGAALAPRTLGQLLQLAGHPIAQTWAKLGNVVDFYSLWAAWMMAFGLAAAGQLPKRRALAATIIGWVCYRLVTRVAIGL
jgi:hypothetical protein